MTTRTAHDRPTGPAAPRAHAVPPAAVDQFARQFLTALVTSLALILPLYVALGVTTDPALLAWVVGPMIAVLGLGYLFRAAGVARARAAALTSAGVFAPAAVVGIWIMSTVDDPADDVGVAVIVGLAATAVSTAVTVTVVRRAGDFAPAVAIVVAVVGALVALPAGASAGRSLQDARDDAELRAAFEEAGLTAYAPEIDGLEAEFTGTTYHQPDAGLTVGYDLVYRPDKDPGVATWEVASVDVKVAVDQPACEEISDYLTCRDADGYVVVERDGEVAEVQASMGSTSLVATFDPDGPGELPDADTVGKALATAESVDWGDVFALRD